MFDRKFVAAWAVGGMLLATPLNAQAGGLFGDGGVFRGTVGNWLDKHVEQPILTPVARATVVIGATAGAVALGGPMAAPIGTIAGNGINNSFAGGNGGQQQVPQQQVAMGGKCATDVAGDFALNGPAPLGSACSVKLPNGKELSGKVTP